ncbi:MAG TPA: hypothetical protein VF158_02260 [Longimicrobiales bacterium]
MAGTRAEGDRMIRPENILFWAGGNVLARYGTLARRTTPGATGITFTRAAGPAALIGRDGRVRQAASDRPRVEWLDLDGDGVREAPAVLVEGERENVLFNSSNFAAGTEWNGWVGTLEPAASLINGQAAYKHINDGMGSSRNRAQTRGVFTGQPETAYVIVENVDAASAALNIRDGTLAQNVCIGVLDWNTGTAAVQSGTGTARAVKLANSGPNGGPVYLLAVTAAGTAGNIRQVFIYPTGIDVNTGSAILHHAQHEEAPIWSSLIVTGTAQGATRPTEVLSAPFPYAPRRTRRIYLRFQERGAAELASSLAPVFGISGLQSRLGIWGSTVYAGGYRVEIVNTDTDPDSFFGSHNPLTVEYGDTVELVLDLEPGNLVLHAATNGGVFTAGSTGNYVAPRQWGVPVAYIGGRLSVVTGFGAYRDVLVVDVPATPAELRELVGP